MKRRAGNVLFSKLLIRPSAEINPRHRTELTLAKSAGGGAVRRFAGPVGGVSLDVEGITGGGLQVPDDLLQSRLADGLLVLHLHRVCGSNGTRG